MGRIASSGDPLALELFRNVLLASAAIPGLFPPVYVEVRAGGELREEMHVDGGTTNQVFLLPNQVEAGSIDAKLGIHPVRRLYIIRNGRLDPEFKAVKAKQLGNRRPVHFDTHQDAGYRRSLSNVRVRPA